MFYVLNIILRDYAYILKSNQIYIFLKFSLCFSSHNQYILNVDDKVCV